MSLIQGVNELNKDLIQNVTEKAGEENEERLVMDNL